MSNWAHRTTALFDAVEAHPLCTVRLARRGPPLSDADLATVEARLGFSLPARFVDFFRAHDGLRLLWVTQYGPTDDNPGLHFAIQREEGMHCGSINVPSLLALFPARMDYRFGRDSVEAGEQHAKVLGGWDEHALREAMRNIDDFAEIVGESSFYLPALIAHPRYADRLPVVMTADYAAAISDHRTMDVLDYLDLVVATAGGWQPRMQALKNFGYGGDHAAFSPAAGWLDALPGPDVLLKFFHDELTLEEFSAVGEAWHAIGN